VNVGIGCAGGECDCLVSCGESHFDTIQERMDEEEA
jgi:hypothetical protein